MKLTPEQVAWVNQEKASLQRVIDSQPKYGLFLYIARLEAIKVTIKLHNIAMDAEKKEREALEARVEAVKEKVKKTFTKDSTQTNSPKTN